jgi:hypothetical protein
VSVITVNEGERPGRLNLKWVWGTVVVVVVVVVARAGMKVLCRRVFHGEGRMKELTTMMMVKESFR